MLKVNDSLVVKIKFAHENKLVKEIMLRAKQQIEIFLKVRFT